MSVGTQAIENYQGEDVTWTFTNADTDLVASLSGFDVELVIKATAAAADPPLIGPITCTVGTTTFSADLNLDLDPGTYVYSARRVDSGYSWQFAQGALTVLDSASID